MFARERMSEGWGCALTILTAGLWIPVWIVVAFAQRNKPFRCRSCGWAAPPLHGVAAPRRGGPPPLPGATPARARMRRPGGGW